MFWNFLTHTFDFTITSLSRCYAINFSYSSREPSPPLWSRFTSLRTYLCKDEHPVAGLHAQHRKHASVMDYCGFHLVLQMHHVSLSKVCDLFLLSFTSYCVRVNAQCLADNCFCTADFSGIRCRYTANICIFLILLPHTILFLFPFCRVCSHSFDLSILPTSPPS